MPIEEIVAHVGINDYLDLEGLKKGDLVKSISGDDKTEEDLVHIKIKHMRNAMKDIYEVYSNPKSKKKDFVKVLEKHQESNAKDINNFLDSMEIEEGEKLLKVVSKKRKGKKIFVEFEEVQEKERMNLVKSIAKKLLAKLTPEQTLVMLQEGLRKMNDVDKLKRVDENLDKKDVKLKEKRGCFFLEIGKDDLFLVG